MNELTLQLKHTPAPIREPVAWFIAGADVSSWLDEICRWAIPQEHLRLFVLPRGGNDRSPGGVLVLPPAGTKPSCVPRALGFGVVAGKLYLPVDAELWPPIEPHELKLVHDVQVFHPALGLVGFEPAESLRLADLLRQPPSRVENWNFARPGVHLNQRLHSVQLLVPISSGEIFGDAPKEIGNEPLEGLPPAPNEPRSNPAGRVWSRVNRQLMQALQRLLRSFPHTGSRRTWINKLEDWAAARFQQFVRDLEAMRNKEIHRLLHQLENDPDEGLRHALPINQLTHRGQAPPSNRLGTRRTDFNLENLRGGKAADFWHLDHELQLQLRSRYQELANRELQLGRFRRAAYIFAELLGDLESAASALKQDRHFREAAVIYKEHLRRPREAAVCLADGGLFQEAIAIYEQELLYLEAGDLYARLGQDEQARAAYEREVQRRVTAGNRLSGAELMETKLNAPDQALTILSDGWPHSQQAGKCLAAEFELLARKSWHCRATARLQNLRAENTRADLVSVLARVLAAQSSQYPDRAVRHSAADLARVKAGQRLETAASRAEIFALSDALTKLAPDDKLLGRDVSRFMVKHNERLRTSHRIEPLHKISGPLLVRSFDLPKAIAWHTVKSCGRHFFAAGNGLDRHSGRRKLFLLRGDWEGAFQTIRWPEPVVRPPPLLLEFDEEITRARIIITPGPSRPLWRLPEKAFPAADRFAGVIPAGTPDWLPEDLVAICTRGLMAWLLRDSGDGLVECRSLDGTLVSSLGLSGVFAGQLSAFLHCSLITQRDFLWVSAKQRLCLFRKGEMIGNWEAETDILSLVPSAPNLPLCLLARLGKGVSLHWIDALKERTETLCEQLTAPLAAFTADGTLILISGEEGRICDVNQRAVGRISAFTLLEGMPIAVVRAQGPNQFAVFYDNGTAQVFRLPA
jgi:hypothetical protein